MAEFAAWHKNVSLEEILSAQKSHLLWPNFRCHDIQSNDIKYNGILYNNIKHIGIQCKDIIHNDIEQ